MKKLNMNSSGMTFIGWGMFFLAISLLLFLIKCVIGSNRILFIAMCISIAIGAIILSILFLLVFIELMQDKVVDRFFEKNVNAKIRISELYFECQNCGNKKVLENQTNCPVCGVAFKEKQKAPFDIFY